MDKNVKLEVGIGATEMMWSDRRAYTVQKILSDKRIIVTRDKAERIDNNGPSENQKYEYTSVPLFENEEVGCTKPAVMQLGKNFCTENNGVCESCKYWKLHKNTNGIELRFCKNGWKEVGKDNYFVVGVREEYFDYSF